MAGCSFTSAKTSLEIHYSQLIENKSSLLKVQNDIAISLDKYQVTALTLPDLSGAFYIIDDTTLADRLRHGCQKVKNKDKFSL